MNLVITMSRRFGTGASIIAKELSGITCNLVGIFYLYPYKYATDAELFLVLKQNYFSSRSYGNTYQAY